MIFFIGAPPLGTAAFDCPYRLSLMEPLAALSQPIVVFWPQERAGFVPTAPKVQENLQRPIFTGVHIGDDLPVFRGLPNFLGRCFSRRADSWRKLSGRL
jgi:hypothetical protein